MSFKALVASTGRTFDAKSSMCLWCALSCRAIWQSLPPMFIGMPCQLQTVVQLLCEELELSFLEAGRPCPPWRSAGATISRWMSQQVTDVSVPAAAATAEEVEHYLATCSRLMEGQAGSSSGGDGGRSSTTGLPKGPAGTAGPMQDSLKKDSVAAATAWTGAGKGELGGAWLDKGSALLGPKATAGAEGAAAGAVLSLNGGSSASCSIKAVSEPKQLQRGFNLAPWEPAGLKEGSAEAAFGLMGNMAAELAPAVEGRGKGLDGFCSTGPAGMQQQQLEQQRAPGKGYTKAVVGAEGAGVGGGGQKFDLLPVPHAPSGGSLFADNGGEDGGSIVYSYGSMPLGGQGSAAGSCGSTCSSLVIVPPAAGGDGAAAGLFGGLSSLDFAQEASSAMAMPEAAAADHGACTAPADVSRLASSASSATASAAGRGSLSKAKSLLTQRLQASKESERTVRGGQAHGRVQSEPWAVEHPGMWLARTEVLLAERRLVAAMDEERRQVQQQLQEGQRQQQPVVLEEQRQQQQYSCGEAVPGGVVQPRQQQQQYNFGNAVPAAAVQPRQQQLRVRRLSAGFGPPPPAPEKPLQEQWRMQYEQQAANPLPALNVSQGPAAAQMERGGQGDERHRPLLQVAGQQPQPTHHHLEQQQQRISQHALQEQQQPHLRRLIPLQQQQGQLPVQQELGQQPCQQQRMAQEGFMQMLLAPGAGLQQSQLQAQYQALLAEQQQQPQQRAGDAGPAQGELPRAARQQRRLEPVKLLRLIPQRSARKVAETAQERR